MNLTLVLIGLGKVAFGLLVGVIGIFLASRVLARMLHGGGVSEAVREGNAALGILNGFAVVSLGILAQHAVSATFNAMDLLYRGKGLEAGMLGRFVGYGLVHVGLSLVVGSGVLALGAWVFGKMTRDVDEVAEVKKGNVSASVVLGGVLLVLSLMTAQGLQTALDGLLPLPSLQDNEQVAPS
jgi:uncharacterized membrane protein YjfL (UPF0719 family)